jgi:3-hydroxyisobutyrate dehydrogenase-like beta-hydroxyacid dehydrogenase
MLLAGTDAADAAKLLRWIGMNATHVSDRIGVASAIKMCRSIIVKGLESLVVESLFAARSQGAEDAVLASLAATYPQMGWTDRLPDYLVSRVAEHGRRRAAEMREAAQMLKGVGFDPWMALATAERQDWLVDEMAARDLAYRADEPFSWRALADRILNA